MTVTQLPRVIVATHLDPDDAELIRSRARKADRSVAAELRRALRASGYLASQPSDETTTSNATR